MIEKYGFRLPMAWESRVPREGFYVDGPPMTAEDEAEWWAAFDALSVLNRSPWVEWDEGAPSMRKPIHDKVWVPVVNEGGDDE
jgi:hypothetical protein